jgi:biofilm PGA synthesis lipoprotein PgaB
MVIPLKKKGLYGFVIILAVSAGFFFCKCYLGRHHILSQCAATSVAEARVPPQEANTASTRRMLAAQVLVFRSRDYAQVEQCMVDLKNAGVNTLIVRAFQNRGDGVYRFSRPQCKIGVYFETSHAPVVDPVLTRIVSIGHRHGLKVFAWMETRKMPLHLADAEPFTALGYCFETRSFKPIPTWSIFDETVEKSLIGLYEDVVGSGIDGILIQDDLVMHQYEDFSPKAIALFSKETGRVLDPQTLYHGVFQDEEGRWLVSRYSDTFWLWARWKNQKLLNLASKLIQAAKGANPEIEVAMNFMYESVTDPKNALAWLSQSLDEAMKLPLDFYAIMAYHRQMKKELQLSEGDAYNKISTMTATLLNAIDDPHKILMKVQMSDWDTRKEIPVDEANQVFRRINNQGQVSLAFIPYSSKVPLQVIRHYFQ